MNMINTVIQFSDDNTSATSGITAYAIALSDAKTKVVLIDALDQIATGTTKGVTTDTNAIREAMSDIAFKCAAATFAYATFAKNNTLKAEVNYTRKGLNRFKKEEIDDICQTIHDATNTNITNVQNYGASATDVTNLQTAITLYRNASQDPRQKRISISDSKSQIKDLIRQIISVEFKGLMDKMAGTLKTSNPNFVNKYFLSRKIIDLGKTTGKLRGTTTDGGKKKIADVLIALRITGEKPIAHQTLSNSEAVFGIANIKPGNYDIEVSKSGFQTITETNIRFGPGKELQRKYIMLVPS